LAFTVRGGGAVAETDVDPQEVVIIEIEELACASTALSTADGPITDAPFATILAGTAVSFASNKSWGLTVK
jgi:hypothetical protein